MKLIFIGRHDWANFAHRIARALRIHGVDARVFVGEPHPYGFVEDTWSEDEFDEWVHDGADWLLTTGDGAYDHFLAARAIIKHRNLAVLHVGSAYRKQSKLLNKFDREHGVQVQFIGVDSLYLADGTLPAYPMWVAPERWQRPDEKRDGILHCPSKRSSKGTDKIIAAADKAGVKLTLLENAAPSDLWTAMSQAAVYVDELNPEVGGIGCAAFEAAALGCAVITDGRHWPLHQRWSPTYTQVRDEDDLASLFADLKGDMFGRTVRTGWHMLHAERDHRWTWDWARPEKVGAYWLETLAKHAR